MAIEVFNRYENKYWVGENILHRLQSRLTDYMELDAFNQARETYSITNLYYDTPDSRLIRASLSKPKYKEKLRLRAYGVPRLDSNVYVEIKKKVGGLVNKRRSAMPLDQAYDFLRAGERPQIQPFMNAQVLREVEFLLTQYDLAPAVYLAYDRRAYFGVGMHDLRVSFDTNIRARRQDLRLESGDAGEPLLEAGMWLMEIKVARSIPVWLTRLLAEYALYPTSFSKYGAEYRQRIAAGAAGPAAIPGRQPARAPARVPVLA